MLGIDHLNTGLTYNNIAGVYSAQKKYTKALEYCQKALTISEKVLGTDHLNTGTTYSNIAGAYQNLGEYEKALEYYQDALAIFKVKLGLQHPDTEYVLNQIKRLKYDKE